MKLSEDDKVLYEIRRYDRRASRPDYLLFLHKTSMIRQLNNSIQITFRKNSQTNNITANQVLIR